MTQSKKEPKHPPHAHRFTLRTGGQLISSVDGGNPHKHTLNGTPTSSDSSGENHRHTIELQGVTMESGPPIAPWEVGLQEEAVNKGLMPDMVDPNHVYVFKTGEYGVYDYWYMDPHGNYWKYTNAPEDNKDHDKYAGVPLLVRDQPTPAEAPSFFTTEGKKRHIGVPPDATIVRNEKYDPLSIKNIWYEVYELNGEKRYVYLDSDIRENVDLWVQYQLRVVDAGLSNFRNFAASSFNKNHPKDKVIGAILMLVDQGLYEVEELADAVVGDIEFIDDTVKLLGRKFICDPLFKDFLTSLVGDREKSAPLFILDTVHGAQPLGYRHLYMIFYYMRVSPFYLLAWHATHIFSKIVNRLSFENVDPEEIEGRAFSELQRVFVTRQDVQYLVDHKVKSTLLENVGASVNKSLSLQRGVTDEYATLSVYSDLAGRHGDEVEFSQWLHAEPLHDITPEEEAEVESQVSEQQALEEQLSNEGEDTGQTDAGEGDVGQTDAGEKDVGTEDKGTSPAPEG